MLTLDPEPIARMKRLAVTILTTVYLPACSGEVSNNPTDAGVLESNDNVRTHTTDAGNSTAPSTSSVQAVATTTAASAHSTQSSGTTGLASGNTTGSGSSLSSSGVSNSTGAVASSNDSTTDVSGTDETEESDTAQSATTTDSESNGDFTSTDSETGSDAESDAASNEQTDTSTSEPSDPAFDIDLVFLDESESSPEVVDSFVRAEAFWEELIIGDLPDITTRQQACNGPDIYVEGTIDDLQIFVAVGMIDGPDGILGAAGPCLGRPTWQGGLPLAGFMQFDSEDLERYAQQGRLDEVIIHEMGHVLGFGGVMWQEQGFLADPSDDNVARDTHFTGEKAIAAFDSIGGNAYSDAKVPVENVGGEGTANGHWREEVMGNEMMTSYMTNLEAVLSTVTLAALEDMGYEVDYTKAGGYEWPPPDERSGLFSLRAEPALPAIDFGDDILDLPFTTIK